MFFERQSMTSDGGSIYRFKKEGQYAPLYTIDSIPQSFEENRDKFPVFAAFVDELKERLVDM
jgi:hypothetical protein